MTAISTPANTARIFVSYSRQDGIDFAHSLRGTLEGRGFSLWQDLIAMRGGRDWWAQIELALKAPSVEHLVFVVTEAALNSGIVHRELRLARQEGVEVSPVRGAATLDLAKLPRWLGHVYDLDRPEEFTKLVRVLEGPSQQQRVPMMAPPPPDDYVERSAEYAELKSQLLSKTGDAVAITAALRGAGGYGKTTLAKKLCHDPDIQEAYFDGIIWVELGANPDKLLAIAADIIETVTGERPGLETYGAASARIAEALGDRCYLFVIDDVWREQDLQLFLLGATHTTRLITTRIDRILPVTAKRVQVDAMAGKEAVRLLSSGLPALQLEQQEEAIAGLAKRLGEWAILLKLVNGFLRQRIGLTKESLESAIRSVNKRLDMRGMTAFDSVSEDARHKAVARTIDVSLELLKPERKERFVLLAAFPEDINVPISVVERFWHHAAGTDAIESEDTLQELLNLSLLLEADFDLRTVRLHDTVRQYLQDVVGKGGLAKQHAQIVEAIGLNGETAITDAQGRRYYFQFLPFHLHGAGLSSRLHQLLSDPGWIQTKLVGTGSPHHLVSDYQAFGDCPLHALLGRTIDLTAAILGRDPKQLFVQLCSRLAEADDASLPELFARAKALMTRPALIPRYCSLTAPGAELRRLEGHEAPVTAISAVDADRIISSSNDRRLRLWDTHTGAEMRQFSGHEDWVLSVAAISPQLTVSGSADRTLRVWSIDTGEALRCIEGHEEAVLSVARFDADRVISASADRTVRLWEISSGRELLRLTGHDDWVWSAVRINDRQIASAGKDGTVRIWDIGSGREIKSFSGHSSDVLGVVRVSDTTIASCSADQSIRVWRIDHDAPGAVLRGHADRVRHLVALDGERILSASDDRTLRLWDITSNREVLRLEGHEDGVRGLALYNRNLVASASNDRSIRAWSLKTGEPPRKGEWHDDWVSAVLIIDSLRALSASDDGTMRIWNLQDRKALAIIQGRAESVKAAILLPGNQVLSGGEDKTMRLWDLGSQTEIQTLKGHDGAILGLSRLNDHTILSASEDHSVGVWDAQHGRLTQRLKGHTDWVKCVARVDERRALSGSEDRTLRLWDIRAGRQLMQLDGHEGAVQSISVLTDKLALSASEDGTARLWDFDKGQQLMCLTGHRGAVHSVIAIADQSDPPRSLRCKGLRSQTHGRPGRSSRLPRLSL